MVLFSMNAGILLAVEEAERHQLLDQIPRGARETGAAEPVADEDEQLPSLDNRSMGSPIAHNQLIRLSQALSSSSATAAGSKYTLEKLLQGANFYHPPPPLSSSKPTQTPEYHALMARLRFEAESRAYDQLTHQPSVPTHLEPYLGSFESFYPNAATAAAPAAGNAFRATAAYAAQSDQDDEMTFADINKQIAVIFNVLVSIFACGAAIWIMARWWSVGARLAVSLGGAGLVGVAEVVVYWGYIRKVDEAKRKEKAKKEVKEIIGTWTVGGEKVEPVAVQRDHSLAPLTDISTAASSTGSSFAVSQSPSADEVRERKRRKAT